MVRHRTRPGAVGVAAVALGLLGCGGAQVPSARDAGSAPGAGGAASVTASAAAGPTSAGGGRTPEGAGGAGAGGADAGRTPADAGRTPSGGSGAGSGTAGGGTTGSAGRTSTGGPPASSPRPADPVLDRSVIVDFAVEWRPESELSDNEVREQRARVQAAQDEVLRDLGRHGRLRRPLHETAQASLQVDATGRRLLREHPRVAAVHDNEAEPASG